MIWKHILAIGLVITLMACQAVSPKILPTKPTLNVETSSTGGICLSKEDSTKLGVYILELERGYK